MKEDGECRGSPRDSRGGSPVSAKRSSDHGDATGGRDEQSPFSDPKHKRAEMSASPVSFSPPAAPERQVSDGFTDSDEEDTPWSKGDIAEAVTVAQAAPVVEEKEKELSAAEQAAQQREALERLNGEVWLPMARDAPATLVGCRSVDAYEPLNKIDEGTYGVVTRARDRVTGDIVALKRIKMEETTGGFPQTSIREINILMTLRHPNVVGIKEIVVGRKLNDVYMVMEYMEHDLRMLLKSMKNNFNQSEVKCLLKQLLEGVAAMHTHWVLHRDLKTSNLLFNNQGILKICDFGMARPFGEPVEPYSPKVITQWYRPPELFLGARKYSKDVDIWSVGCIFAELLTRSPLFPCRDGELKQLAMIFQLVGTPTAETWPEYSSLPAAATFHFKHCESKLRAKFPPPSHKDLAWGDGVWLSDAGFDLLSRMLALDPKKRISADDALRHPYFSEAPLPQHPSQMPTFDSLNEDATKRKHAKAAGVGAGARQPLQ